MAKLLQTSIGIFLIGITLMSGCGKAVPTFKKVEVVPEGMGLIYIYRPDKTMGRFSIIDVYSGKGKIISVSNAGYFPYFVKPGEVELWTEGETKSSVTLDIKSGETYYVRTVQGFGMVRPRPQLGLVPEGIAKPEIAFCALINKDQ